VTQYRRIVPSSSGACKEQYNAKPRVNPRISCTRSRRGDRCLHGQSRIRYSLPPPGFNESGIHLASATDIPRGFHVDSRTGIHGQKESRFRILFYAPRIAHVGIDGSFCGVGRLGRRAPKRLAFTRYCDYQYCMANIETNDGWGKTLKCTLVWAVKGWCGVLKQGGCLRIRVLILVQRPRTKRISSKGQPNGGVDWVCSTKRRSRLGLFGTAPAPSPLARRQHRPFA